MPHVRFSFTNYGVSVGLQAVQAMPERVDALNAYFETYRSGDEYDPLRHHPCDGVQLSLSGIAAEAVIAR